MFKSTITKLIYQITYHALNSCTENIHLICDVVAVTCGSLLQSNLCRDRDVVLCYICKPSDPV